MTKHLYFLTSFGKTDINLDEANFIDLSLSEQIKRLTTLLEIPPEELHKKQAACEEVLQSLRKFYPDSSLLLHGSSVNSFGIKGCVMDLRFTPFHNYSDSDYMVDEAEEVTIPDPASVLSGEVSYDVLTKFNQHSHLKFIRAVLKHGKIAKTAYITLLQERFFLRVMNFKEDNTFMCNISAGDKFTVFKSELLELYGKIDERVKPLVICLQFWVRSLGLVKRSFFPLDTCTWLVIFFLQSVHPPILPSIQRLKEISGFSRMIAGWETAFCTDIKKIPKSKNTLTVGELFAQFFDFYFHFDFSQNVVSPHSGRPLPIKDIQNSIDARMADFKIKRVNIQDLFILSNNVSAVEKVSVIKLAFLTASEMLKGNGKMQFPTFFNPDAYQRKLDTHYNRYFSNKTRFCLIHLDYDYIQKFDSLQMWYDKASEAVYNVLQYGLLMECEVKDKVSSIMKKHRTIPVNGKRVEDSSIKWNNKDISSHPLQIKTSTPYDLQLLISIQCLMYSRTYVERENVVTTLDSQNDLEGLSDSVLGIEHRISKSLVNENYLLKSSAPFVAFDCECYSHVSPELTDFIVMLKPLTVPMVNFKHASQFLVVYLPEVVKKILISD